MSARHVCDAPEAACDPLEGCYEDVRGRLYLVIDLEGMEDPEQGVLRGPVFTAQVNYCPFCGAKAPLPLGLPLAMRVLSRPPAEG